MPPIGYPGNSISKEARAKAGGGFESAIEAVEPPPSGDPATAFFTDDFASGDISKSEGGFSWTAGIVEVGAGRTSGNAIRCRYGPDSLGEDSSSEPRFVLSPNGSTAPTEVWFEYYLFIPQNYIHRNDPPSNNKFFALWAEQYSNVGDIQFVCEFDREDDTTDIMRAVCMSGRGCLTGASPNNLVEPSVIGSWVRIRIHQKAGDGTGLSKVWRDNLIVYSIEDYVHHFDGGNNYWRNGYLMGYANSGFADQTDFYIDEFKVWRQDPQWSFS